jgi:peptidoglycan/xylan/chitin deacetylase (PgdA/CDA1 family)
MIARLVGRRLLWAAAEVLFRTGAIARHARRHRERLPILVYHRVNDQRRSAMDIPTQRFREQMRYLNANCKVVPLSQIASMIRDGAVPEKNTVAVTFDDGYRDNLTRAAPILRSLGMPATVFVATGPQEYGAPLWWDVLDLAGTGDVVNRARMKGVSHAELQATVKELLAQLPPHEVSTTVSDLYLSWDDIRAWRNLGMEVGAHTVTHPIVSKLPLDQAAAEIRESRAAIERETGCAVPLFAYPNGKTSDFSPETTRELERQGFAAACCTVERLNDQSSNLFELSRIVARDEPLALFAFRLAGLYPSDGVPLRRKV